MTRVLFKFYLCMEKTLRHETRVNNTGTAIYHIGRYTKWGAWLCCAIVVLLKNTVEMPLLTYAQLLLPM